MFIEKWSSCQIEYSEVLQSLVHQNIDLTKANVRVILRYSCIPVKRIFAKVALTDAISFRLIIAAAVRMIIAFTCCNK